MDGFMLACYALVGAVMLSAGTSGMAQNRRQDDRALRTWVRDHITGRITPPFSLFTGDTGSRELVQSWRRAERTRRLDTARVEHVVQWSDMRTGMWMRMEAIEYRDVPSVQWVVRIGNGGATDTPVLRDIRALDVQFIAGATAPVRIHYALGDSNSADSFRPVVEDLLPGAERTFAAVGGRPSQGFMPYFNIEMERGGAALAIGWTGQWAASFIRDPTGVLRVQAGMERTYLKLHPGEEIRTPRILLTFWTGSDPLRGNQLLRATLMRHVTPRRNGEIVFPPICGTVLEADPDGNYEQPHVRVMKPLAELGMEVFWSDMDPQHWYPGGFPAGTGTWEPDPAKYPRGLKPVGDAARAAGLGYLLWFEPERVAPGTQIAREHPEWVSGGPNGGLFRLDLPEARHWLMEKIDRQITEAGLSWVRWDFNMDPLSAWRSADPPDRHGMTEIRHVQGLYAMWDELARRHPGLLMDICASGGRRLDIEMLSRGLPLWHSDLQCDGPHREADQLQNAALYRWLPLHACGVFALEPDYAFRSAATTGNVFALPAHAPEHTAGVRRSVAFMKRIRPFVLGDFYPTFPHTADADRWFGYQFHRPDLDAGYVIMFRRARCADATTVVPIRGVQPSRRYAVTLVDTGERRVVSGQELEQLRIEVPDAPGSAVVFYEPEQGNPRTRGRSTLRR